MSEHPRLVIRGLSEAYSRKSKRGARTADLNWALRDLDLTVDAGEMVGVIGANGSGKTTLLQCIVGVLKPTRGEVLVDGRTGSIFDLSVGFHRELSGRENIVIAGVLGGLTRTEVARRVAAIADFAELDDDALDQPMLTYSSGMALRLGLAVVVNSDVDLLLIDEVLAVGDAEFQAKCVAKVHALQGEGCTVVMVSHDLQQIVDHCNRAIVLDEGRLIFDGEPAEAIASYRETSNYTLTTPDISYRSLRPAEQVGDRRRRRRGA